MGLPPIQEAIQTQQTEAVGQQNIVKEETDPKEVTLSPQLTALARKQQKLQQEIQAQRDKEAAFTAKEADYIPKSQIKAKMETNAVQTLQELGFTYEEVTNLILSQQSGADPHAQELKALKDEVQSIKSTSEQNVSKQYEATINQYKVEVKKLTQDNPEFKAINKKNAHEAVVKHIEDTFNEDGEILTVEQASKDIEDYLRDEAKEWSSILEEKKEPVEEKKLPAPKTGLRTLTQQVASIPPERTHNQSQYLSMKERIAQAVAKSSQG